MCPLIDFVLKITISYLLFYFHFHIRHNFNLAHSGGLDGSTYSDKTGFMGNPAHAPGARYAGNLCYDAAKVSHTPPCLLFIDIGYRYIIFAHMICHHS